MFDLLFLFAELAKHEVVLSPDGTGNKTERIIFSQKSLFFNVSKVQLMRHLVTSVIDTDAPGPGSGLRLQEIPDLRPSERHPGCNGCLDRQYVIIGGCCLLQPLSSDTERRQATLHCDTTGSIMFLCSSFKPSPGRPRPDSSVSGLQDYSL